MTYFREWRPGGSSAVAHQASPRTRREHADDFIQSRTVKRVEPGTTRSSSFAFMRFLEYVDEAGASQPRLSNMCLDCRLHEWGSRLCLGACRGGGDLESSAEPIGPLRPMYTGQRRPPRPPDPLRRLGGDGVPPRAGRGSAGSRALTALGMPL